MPDLNENHLICEQRMLSLIATNSSIQELLTQVLIHPPSQVDKKICNSDCVIDVILKQRTTYDLHTLGREAQSA